MERRHLKDYELPDTNSSLFSNLYLKDNRINYVKDYEATIRKISEVKKETITDIIMFVLLALAITILIIVSVRNYQ